MKTNDPNDQSQYQTINYELKTAQAADAARQAYQKEMNAMPVVAPTTSSNIDTELLTASSNIERALNAAITGIIAFDGTDYKVLEKLVKKTLDTLKSDRNKLIKHLAFEMGESEEYIRGIVETMK